MGCLCIRNWPGIGHKIIGFTALVVILIGARMTVWSERKEASNAKNLRRAVILLLMVNLDTGYIQPHRKQLLSMPNCLFTSSNGYGNCCSHLWLYEYESRESIS